MLTLPSLDGTVGPFESPSSVSDVEATDMIPIFDIEEKRKQFWAQTADADNFSVRLAGEADPSIVVEDPNITLYCVDPSESRALFVRTPEDVDIAEGPFFYAAQYDHAHQVLAVPYDLFHELGAKIHSDAPLVHVHSTGRAGSTLMSKAFAEMDATMSLSEPDIYTQVAAMSMAGTSPHELLPILRSAVAFLFKPSFTHGASLHVVKHRSFSIEVADLIAQVSPEAGNLFLYRDLAPFMLSATRGFGLLGLPLETRRAWSSALGSFSPVLQREAAQRDLEGVEIGACIWLSAMLAFGRAHGEGLAMLPVRYEDLVARPQETMEMILAYLGLPASRVDVALRAFERDSQAGSPLAREEVIDADTRLEPEHWDLVRDLVGRYPLMDVALAEKTLPVP
ncbi:MAG TPA: sulfotransferase [Chloroflexota bacterium]